jgi:hypothetical protein
MSCFRNRFWTVDDPDHIATDEIARIAGTPLASS